jgi:hypothetical protein
MEIRTIMKMEVQGGRNDGLETKRKKMDGVLCLR